MFASPSNISIPSPSSPASNISLAPRIPPNPANPSPLSNSGPHQKYNYIRLSPTDLQAVRFALGATTTRISDPTSSETPLIHPASTIWPPSGLPPGLYKDILHSLAIAKYQYLIITLIFNSFLILQLILGASLTALGSSASSSPLTSQNGIPITVLASLNTTVAGLIALMHHSNRPHKYRQARFEYEDVEMRVKEVLEVGIVNEGWGVDEVIEWCFEMYFAARRKVDGGLRTESGAMGTGTTWRGTSDGTKRGVEGEGFV